jgi:hypothetical protein
VGEPAAQAEVATPSPKPEAKLHEIIMDAGGEFLHEDKEDGIVHFRDPQTKKLFSIPVEEATPQNIAKMLGKHTAMQEPDAEQPSDPNHPQYDINQHWTHQAPEDLVGHVRGLLDKVDQHREKGDMVPSSVLAARHNLLQEHDYGKMLKNAAIVDNYLSNPDALPVVKPPVGEDFFKKTFNTQDITHVPLNEAVQKLQGHKPVNALIAKKQGDTLAKLKSEAEGLGLKEDFTVDPTKDNRQLLAYYKARVASAAKNKLGLEGVVNTPMITDQHIQDMNHLGEMAEMLKKHKLDIPHYQDKINQLAFFLDQSPDSNEVPKLFNDLHNYAYERGENDPHHMAHRMLLGLDDVKAKTPEQQAGVEGLKSILQNAVSGNAHKQIAQALEYAEALKKQGVNVPIQMPEKTNYNRSAWDKAKLDTLLEHRKLMDKKQEMEKEEKAAEQAQNANPLHDEQSKQPMIPGDPSTFDPQTKLKIKSATNTVGYLKNAYKSYMDILKQVKEENIRIHEGDDTHTALSNLYRNIVEDAGKLDAIRNELGKVGVPIPEFDVKQIPHFGSDSNEKLDKEDMDDHRRDMNTMLGRDKRESENAQWLRREAIHTHNDVQAIRTHFLMRASNHLPAVQQDLKAIDQHIGQMLNAQQYKPIDPNLAVTPQGKQFISHVNDKLESLIRRSDMVKIPLEEALGKSLTDLIAAEKTLARRDVSIALRKAFYNDKHSTEVQHATNLLGSYIDDFIDAVMTSYTNIPSEIRKSITRKLLKSLINDVIKDNEYSASNMKADFTAPLTEDVVKALGRKIAGIVTEFRMQAEDKPFLVVGLSKSVETKTEPPVIQPFQHDNALLKGPAYFTPDMWFTMLNRLESDMLKAGIIATKVSPHRIEKFVADNDQKAIRDLYNESVQLLNERLGELDNG